MITYKKKRKKEKYQKNNNNKGTTNNKANASLYKFKIKRETKFLFYFFYGMPFERLCSFELM